MELVMSKYYINTGTARFVDVPVNGYFSFNDDPSDKVTLKIGRLRYKSLKTGREYTLEAAWVHWKVLLWEES
jgi:hypothetical protein